jgi:hypothetical protein
MIPGLAYAGDAGKGCSFQGTWLGKLSGNITLSSDCAMETITGRLDVFVPGMTGYESPFDGTPVVTAPLPEHYGRRTLPPSQLGRG